VLGLEVALATGERTRCGGRVVKNVTGYDLMKLHVGAFGSLGVIASAWVRLRPRPEATWTGAAPLAPGERGLADALAAARLATARAAVFAGAGLAPEVVAGADGARPLLLVELAGDAPAVEADRGRLAERVEVAPAPPGSVGRARAAQDGPAAGVRVRVAALPTRLPAAAAALAAGGARLLAHPGRGLVWGLFELAPGAGPAEARLALDAAARAARAGGGPLLVEAAPAAVRAATDVFGELGPLLGLHRALKERFDPHGTLNPGRFAGRL
jgi:glycolate oxidase FAD binding subunit